MHTRPLISRDAKSSPHKSNNSWGKQEVSSRFPSSCSLFQSVTSTIKSCWRNNLSTVVSSSGGWNIHAPASGKPWIAHSVDDDVPAIVPSVVEPDLTLEVIHVTRKILLLSRL